MKIILTKHLPTDSAPGVETVVGSGNLIRETRGVRDFHGVKLAGVGDLAIQFGASEEIVIEAEDNILPRITTEIIDGTLRIGWTAGVVQTTKPVRMVLTAHALDAVAVSGSGGLAAGHDLEVPALQVNLKGSGRMKLSGRTGQLRLTMKGSASFDGGDLCAEDIEADIRGSGEAIVWAAGKLEAKLSGRAVLSYYGSPTLNEQHRGSSAIRPLGNKPR